MAAVQTGTGKPRRVSIRSQLIGLVAAVAVPLLGLEAWNLYAAAREDGRRAREQVFHLAQVTASDTARFLGQAQNFLNGLAERPAVRALDPSRCDPVLKDFIGLAPRFANAVTIAMDGRIICSAVPLTASTRADPGRFLNLMRAPDQLTVGVAAPGVITGRWIAPVGRPLLDARGAVIGAVVLPIDLLRIPVLPNVAGLPANTIVGLVAADGTVLARSAEAERFIGTKAGASRTVAREKSGTAETIGIDGIPRIQGFAPVPGTDWIAVASLPSNEVYAGIRARIATSALAAIAVLAGSILLAIRWARGIHKPIAAIAATANEVAGGNLAARAPVAGAAEIAEVAAQFNRMLDARAGGEAELRQAQQLAKLAHAVIGPDGSFEYWSDGLPALIGVDAAAIPKDTRELLAVVHPDDRAMLRDRSIEAAKTGKPMDVEYRLQRGDGAWTHIRHVVEPLPVAAGAAVAPRWFCTVQDVTQYRRVEAALRESEFRFRTVFEQVAVGVAQVDSASGRFTLVNRRYAEITGYSQDEMKRLTYQEITHPEDMNADVDAMTRLRRGEVLSYSMEKRYLRKDGAIVWVKRWVSGPSKSGGLPEFHTAVVEDITARKRAETLLAAEKALLELVAAGAPLNVILEATVRSVEAFSSGMLCSVLLLDADGVHLRHGAAPSLPDDYNRAIDGVAIGPNVGSCGTAAYRNQPVIVTDIATDSLWDDFRAVALQHGLRACWSTPIRSGSGEVRGTFAMYYREPRAPTPADLELIERTVHLTGIAIERKRAGDALRHAESLLRTIVEGTKALLVSVDASGYFIYANEAAARAVGFANPSEMIGKPYLHFVHPEDRSRVFNTFLNQANAFQQSCLQEFRLVDAAGKVRWFSFLSSLAVGDGKVVGQSGVAQDVTERKQAELALQESRAGLETLTRRLLEVQESERRTLARELHDEVGGVLTAVKLNLQSLRGKHRGDSGEAALADGIALVDGAIQSVRSLSLGLRPAVLDDLGLIPALRWYCARQAQRAGIPIELALDAIDLKPVPQLESACFRIVQESVTNALRHANARRIAVALRRSVGSFALEITDDGGGFDVAAARARGLAGESSGLLGMEERATLLDGRLGIDSAPGAGARVRAEFVLPEGGLA